jgi:hypothetical protein
MYYCACRLADKVNKVDAAGGDKQQAVGGPAGDVPPLRVRRGNTNMPRKTTLLVAARKVRAEIERDYARAEDDDEEEEEENTTSQMHALKAVKAKEA